MCSFIRHWVTIHATGVNNNLECGYMHNVQNPIICK